MMGYIWNVSALAGYNVTRDDIYWEGRILGQVYIFILKRSHTNELFVDFSKSTNHLIVQLYRWNNVAKSIRPD